ncbi:MAG: DUF58 domain-containing protein, partial [Cyclobacteriaceae bacterium]
MKLVRSLFLTQRFFQAAIALVILFIISFVLPATLWVPKILFFCCLGLVVTDFVLLYRVKKGMYGMRFTPDKLSNGDENEIRIYLENFYVFKVGLTIFDELPHQFQRRDLEFQITLTPGEKK